ncbi:response regulator transcription factor [Rhizobium sp. XQZ8]|uniref:response regulator n=1 Tax=Rhizobium populisoli TaxID=2859785 RepID=UPI001C685583|nr:response regulator transcription factor [Rhizobium populisoli]MBW6425181.1 response regulator transcription factor [Rhizobium populisoli]
MNGTLRVGIVDDHPFFRAGVASTLVELGMDVVAEGACAADAIAIAREHGPDVILLDISMPGGGLEAIDTIVRTSPHVKIVMLTASEDGEHVRKALQLGACGYVLKGVGPTTFADVLKTVAEGERYVASDLSLKLIAGSLDAAEPANLSYGLSAREIDVIELVAMGLSNKVIGRRLSLHEKTVKHHMTKIMAKFGASNRTEAALKWQASGAKRPAAPLIEKRLDS